MPAVANYFLEWFLMLFLTVKAKYHTNRLFSSERLYISPWLIVQTQGCSQKLETQSEATAFKTNTFKACIVKEEGHFMFHLRSKQVPASQVFHREQQRAACFLELHLDEKIAKTWASCYTEPAAFLKLSCSWAVLCGVWSMRLIVMKLFLFPQDCFILFTQVKGDHLSTQPLYNFPETE